MALNPTILNDLTFYIVTLTMNQLLDTSTLLGFVWFQEITKKRKKIGVWFQGSTKKKNNTENDFDIFDYLIKNLKKKPSIDKIT